MSDEPRDDRRPAVPGPVPPVPDAAPSAAAPRVPAMPPTPEVALGAPSVELPPRIPGAPRDRFDRLPTAPVPEQVASGPAEAGTENAAVATGWSPAAESAAAARRGVAAWALALAVVSLVLSMFVGWGFPLGIAAVVVGILALRRPLESRAVAWWAIALGVLSVLYSAGWLIWAGPRLAVFG